MEPNGIQEVARSIRVSSTNKIKHLVNIRTVSRAMRRGRRASDGGKRSPGHRLPGRHHANWDL